MPFKVGKGKIQVKLEEVITSSVAELLIDIIGKGALVSMGLSRDGGALACTVTLNGEWDREWFRTEEELVEWMAEAADLVGEMTAQPSTGKRSTRAALKPV